ncbi:MAG: hypothetical protein NUV98_02510 [Candidatus Roizmanbacteria bacterium]|nr:hypothetical protein [Candidatus Roizmanbacteria bacterium]
MKKSNIKNRPDRTYRHSSGQAVIVLVLVVAIVVLMFTHVTILSFSSIQTSDEYTNGEFIQMKTEGYLESAAIRYLRDSAYTGETLNEGTYSCTMVVQNIGGNNRDLESTCSTGGRSRTVGMQAVYNAGMFEFSPMEQR